MNSRSISWFVAALVCIFYTACIAEGSTLSILSDSCSHTSVNTTGGIATLNQTCTSAGSQTTSTASAVATYGRLGVGTSENFSLSNPPISAYVFGIDFVSDDITISSGLLNGSQGTLLIDYSLDGTITDTGLGVSVVQVAMDVRARIGGISTDQSTNEAYTSSTSGNFRAPAAFQFVYGQAFTLSLCLGAASGNGIAPAVLPSSGHLSTFQCAPGLTSAPAGTGTS